MVIFHSYVSLPEGNDFVYIQLVVSYGDPQVTIGFNTKMVSSWDDLGYPHFRNPPNQLIVQKKHILHSNPQKD